MYKIEREGCLNAIIMFLFMMVLSIGILFLFTYFAMLLWNGIVVDLFDLPVITYWKMLGLMFLIKLLTWNGVNYRQYEKDDGHTKNKR